jgi:hypothetical protein
MKTTSGKSYCVCIHCMDGGIFADLSNNIDMISLEKMGSVRTPRF